MEKMNITHKIVAMQPELEHFAYKLTADRESANDLVQDCLLKALDNKEKFVHTQNFKGWSIPSCAISLSIITVSRYVKWI